MQNFVNITDSSLARNKEQLKSARFNIPTNKAFSNPPLFPTVQQGVKTLPMKSPCQLHTSSLIDIFCLKVECHLSLKCECRKWTMDVSGSDVTHCWSGMMV